MRRRGAAVRGRWSRARWSSCRPDESRTVSEPLWELGVGVAGFRFDDYRGSDHTNTYLLPMPFFAYRGPILRADRDGARARSCSTASRVAVDVSLGASVPTKSKDDAARRGMPDLAGTFEIGPNLVVELWQASNRKLKVELRMPRARGDHARALAARDRPHVLAQPEPRHRRPARQRQPGPARRAAVRATSATTSTSTASPRSSRPRRRPAYEAPGGYAGWRATTAFSRRYGNAWLGAFVRYDNLHGAAFAPSPLVRKETTVTAGFGISWIFATSSQRVLTDD